MDNLSLFSLTMIFFLIMDPIGNISSYLTLVSNLEPKRRNIVLLREMLIALVAMVFFNFIGDPLIEALDLTHTTIRLSSAVLLFIIAIKILFPATNSLRANLPKGEPFIIPLAIPLIAGPALIATIMLYTSLESGETLMLSAIFIAWAASSTIFFFAASIKHYLGSNGLMALEKLMGMVLVILAIQRFSEGIHTILTEHM